MKSLVVLFVLFISAPAQALDIQLGVVQTLSGNDDVFYRRDGRATQLGVIRVSQ